MFIHSSSYEIAATAVVVVGGSSWILDLDPPVSQTAVCLSTPAKSAYV